jgi:hypothetical protein
VLIPQGCRFLSFCPTLNSGTLNPILCRNCELFRYHLFSIIFHCRLKRLLQLFLSQLWTHIYSLGADRTENTISVDMAQHYSDFCLIILFRWNLFTESLPSNELLLWLRNSGFQASCHSVTATVVSCVLTHVLPVIPDKVIWRSATRSLAVWRILSSRKCCFQPALCWFLVVLFFGPEVGADMIFQNVGWL